MIGEVEPDLSEFEEKVLAEPELLRGKIPPPPLLPIDPGVVVGLSGRMPLSESEGEDLPSLRAMFTEEESNEALLIAPGLDGVEDESERFLRLEDLKRVEVEGEVEVVELSFEFW